MPPFEGEPPDLPDKFYTKRKETPEDIRREVTEHLEHNGFGRLTLEQKNQIYEDHKQALIDGKNGVQTSGLSLTNSHIRPIPLAELPIGKKAGVWVIGGTHLRVAQVSVLRGPVVTIEQDFLTKVSKYAQTPVPKTIFQSATDFYETMTHALSHSTETVVAVAPDAWGMIYSFYGDSIIHDGHSDIRPRVDKKGSIGKGFIAPGIEKTLVGPSLLATHAFDRYNYVPYWAVGNDGSVMKLVGGDLAMIWASGYQESFEINGLIHTTESGHFNKLPTNIFSDELDRTSDNPGQGLAEKQFTGKYIGHLFGLILNDLQANGFLDSEMPDADTWSSVQLGKFLSDPSSLDGYSDHDKEVIRTAARITVDRARDIVAALISSTIDAFPEEFSGDEIKMLVEGALFWKLDGVKEHMGQDIKEMTARDGRIGKDIKFLEIEHSDIIGVGMLALYPQMFAKAA